MPCSPELILAARAGDVRALEALIGEYQVPMGRFVISHTGSRDECVDLCQAIFVKMMLGLPRLKSVEVFEPWLFQIARNVCTDHLRRQRSNRELFVPLAERHDVSVPLSAPTRDAPELQAATEQLAPNQRALLTLSLEKPRSYGELASMTKLSVPAVKNRLFRARERLRQLLRSGEDDQ